MEEYQRSLNRPQTLDTLLVLNYIKRKPMLKRMRLVSLVRALVIAVSIQLLHLRIVRLARLVERLQMRVMQLKENVLAEKK